MKANKHYTKYVISDGDFQIGVKVGDKGITLVNKYDHTKTGQDIKNTFLFRKSTPEMIDNFAKAMKLAVKLSKEAEAQDD